METQCSMFDMVTLILKAITSKQSSNWNDLDFARMCMSTGKKKQKSCQLQALCYERLNLSSE